MAMLTTLCLQENGMIVYVEKKVLEDPAIASDDNFGPVKKKFCTFREGEPLPNQGSAQRTPWPLRNSAIGFPCRL